IKRIVLDRFHRVWIRFVTRPRDNAEITVLGVDRGQATVANLHPRDVVAHRRHFPPGKMFRRNEHGKISLAARARESGRDIMFFSFGRFDTADEHVFGEPALFAREIRRSEERRVGKEWRWRGW